MMSNFGIPGTIITVLVLIALVYLIRRLLGKSKRHEN